MLKGIIFDIDETLYSFRATDDATLPELFEYGSKRLGMSYEEYSAAYYEGRKRHKDFLQETAAIHNRVFYFQYMLEMLGKSTFEHVIPMMKYYYVRFWANIKPFDGIIDILQELKEKNIKIALCTDMVANVQYKKIDELGMTSYIDYMVSSEEIGVEKPAPIMFEQTVKKLGLKKEDIVMVGDSLPKDVLGAKAVGIRALWKTKDSKTAEALGLEYFDNYVDGTFRRLIGLSE